MEYIEIKDYSKKLGHNLVLDKINLSIHKGSVIGLYGRNAAGKTMLLRAIAGLILPTEGSIYVDQIELYGKNRFPKNLGLIIENINFWPNLDAKNTLELLASLSSGISREDIDNVLQRVGLDPKSKMKVKKFSLGMKQKLALAQALLGEPELLLLDEPTNSLDEDARKDFVKIIREESARGCTVVIASHIAEDLMLTCDDIYQMESGKIKGKIEFKPISYSLAEE